jgi:hypothetical protein
VDFKQSIFERNGKKKTCVILKPDLAAHHAAKAGATGPAAADLALQKQVAVFVADSHATAAAVAVVVGVERAGEPGGGGAGVGVRKADGLHWISKEVVVRGSKGVMTWGKKIFLYHFWVAIMK